MQLLTRIALIGGPECGDHGDSDDCNIYAVSTSAGTVLIDAGVGRNIDDVLATAAGDGIDPGSFVALLLTHAHLDHAGGAHALRERLGVPTIASAETARRLEEADEESIALPRARRAGMYRATDRLQRCDVSRVVSDGEEISFGDTTFHVLETPGHSDDHLCYLTTIDGRSALISGDLLFPGGTVALLNTHDCNLGRLVHSLERLRVVDFELLLAGHLAPTLTSAHRDRDAALAALDALVIPRSIV
jgi:glyoxylase-like metal-dependent hydrolase (beta-lactamase superfamily II)